ncbi:MAG: hypothetical protein ACLUB2_02695 [Butyricicoccus pullicaecorum]
MEDMIRYSVITEKNPREIVLLRGFAAVEEVHVLRLSSGLLA